MNKYKCVSIVISMFFLIGFSGISSAQKDVKASTPNNAEESIEQAKRSNKYLFILFYDTKDESFKLMDKEIDNYINSSPKKILKYKAATIEEKEAGIIKKYGIGRASLPVVLVFAPNGAVTGGFPNKVTSQQLEKCIVSELTMKILKSLQERKIVLVLLQNNKTQYNKESAEAAKEFSNEEGLKGYVEIINADPVDEKNKEFITQCKLDSSVSEATLVFLAPPGSIVGIYKGKITKETLTAALSSCGSGCGSGGCGPSK